MRYEAEPGEAASKITHIDGDTEYWLVGYRDGTPQWGRDKENAIWLRDRFVNELIDRYGSAAGSDRGIKTFDRPAGNETERLKDIVGRDYWDHIT